MFGFDIDFALNLMHSVAEDLSEVYNSSWVCARGYLHDSQPKCVDTII